MPLAACRQRARGKRRVSFSTNILIRYFFFFILFSFKRIGILHYVYVFCMFAVRIIYFPYFDAEKVGPRFLQYTSRVESSRWSKK